MKKSIVTLVLLMLSVWIGLPYAVFALLGRYMEIGTEDRLISLAIASSILLPATTWFWWLYHTYVRKKR